MKAATRAQIPPFYVMQALSEATVLENQGIDIVHLSLGQPASKPPHVVLERVAKMATSEGLGYTVSTGIQPLRERIAEHYQQQYGVSVDPARIFITVGSSAAYMLALIAAFEAGDEIAIAAPHYPASPNMMKALNLEPLILRTSAETNYHPTVAMLKALKRKPAGLVIASPANPTGTVIDPAEFQKIILYCEQEGIRLISDEIYHGVTFGDARAVSVLEHSQQMIVTNSFSKYYLLPGWRLGWCVMPEDLVEPIECLLQNFYISPPTLSQFAALEVMKHRDDLDAVVAQYDQNRALLLEQLPQAGMTKIAPAQGAFYLYADVSDLTHDSREFCHQMLQEAHVCAVPGIDFDAQDGHRYVRFSYAGAQADMQTACDRLRRWLAGASKAV